MTGRAALLLTAVVIVVLAACAAKTSKSGVEIASDDRAEASERFYRETGTASWYGRIMQGKPTASGEPFDMHAMTAAHRLLPLGAVVRVTNLENYKSVIVKVNDRGPFVRDRVIELSYGAAKKLGFASQGKATVRIECDDLPMKDARFTVEAAAFAEEENARMLKMRLHNRFETIAVVPFDSNEGRFYRVQVGAYPTEEKAERIAGKLSLEGLEPFVLRKD